MEYLQRHRPPARVSCRRRVSGQRGAALLEFALVAPLFLTLIYGIRGIVTLTRARYELTVVAHAVMREAASGVTSEAVLTALANGYAKAMGLRLTDRLVVTLEPAGPGSSAAATGPAGPLLAGIAPGVRIRVASLVPVGSLLPGRWTHGLPMSASSVCLIGCWKSPMTMLKAALHAPNMDKVGGV